VGFGTEDGSLLGPWNERWTQLDKRLVHPDVLDQAEIAFKVRGEYLILHGHLSEKEIRDLVRMSGTCGEDRVDSQISDEASCVEEKHILVRDVAMFTDTPPAMLNNALAPPPNMPPPGQGVPETVSTGTEDAGQITSLFDKQVSTVIEITQDLWKRTSGIKDMPNSLWIYVLLHRAISKFNVEFNHEPNLNHFIDALSNHEIPKALKNAPGLSCKACQGESSHQHPGAFYSKSEERTTYTVLSLLSHFRTQHLPYQQPIPGHGTQVPLLDWKEDMIELPSNRFISGLIHAPGMDDEKLLIIATVFPSLFPMPLPKIGVIDSQGLPSPASSDPKEGKEPSGIVDVRGGAVEQPDPSTTSPAQIDVALPSKPLEAGFGPMRPSLAGETNKPSNNINRKRSYRDSSPTERRQHHYPESRYYVGDLQYSSEYVSQTNILPCQMSRDHPGDGYHRLNPTEDAYGRRLDVKPGSLLRFDDDEAIGQSTIDVGLLEDMVEEVEAAGTFALAGMRWTRIDRRLVDARVLEAAGEHFGNAGNSIILHRVLRCGELEEWVKATKRIRAEQEKQGDTAPGRGDEGALVRTQEKTLDTGAQPNKAEIDKQRKPERSVSRTRILRETRRGGESWRDGRGEKDRQQAKLDRILAGDVKEDQQRHYRDDDLDFEHTPPSPIQQLSHITSDTEDETHRIEDPAPVLDLDTIDLKDYYDNSYTKSRSHARWTRVDKLLVDEQVLTEAEEDFDDGGDVFYVHRVLRRVEVQRLAQITRSRRNVLREIAGKGFHLAPPRPPRSYNTSYEDTQESENNTNLPPEENSKTDKTNLSDMPSSRITQPPEFISELPASNHHCIVYDAGSSAGSDRPSWRWTCCNCGGDNSCVHDAGCSHCQNHWRE
jgi:hypothetical protein